MKRLPFYYAIAVIFLISACGDDDKPAYSFKNQDASGEIDNVAWTYEDGYVWIDEDEGEEILVFNIFMEQDDDACDVIFADGGSVSFEVPNEVGVHKVSPPNNAIILDDDLVNHIASGHVEIVSVTETSVTGKIDIKSDSENFINGNFTVNFCD